jgi:hypothetical protein
MTADPECRQLMHPMHPGVREYPGYLAGRTRPCGGEHWWVWREHIPGVRLPSAGQRMSRAPVERRAAVLTARRGPSTAGLESAEAAKVVTAPSGPQAQLPPARPGGDRRDRWRGRRATGGGKSLGGARSHGGGGGRRRRRAKGGRTVAAEGRVSHHTAGRAAHCYRLSPAGHLLGPPRP